MRSSRLRFADSSPERPRKKRFDGFETLNLLKGCGKSSKKGPKSSSSCQTFCFHHKKRLLFFVYFYGVLLKKLEVIMEHVKEAFRSSVHYILNTPLKFSMENMKPKHVSPEEEIPVAEIIIFRSQ